MHTRQLFSLLSWKWCTCDKTAEFNCTLICTKVIKNSIIKLKIIKLKYHCTIINLEGQKIALAKKSSGTLSTPGDRNPGFMLGRKLQHPQPSARRCPWWELLGSGAPPAASLPHCLGWHCAVTPNISRDHNPVIAARDSQLTRVKIRKGEGNKNKKKMKRERKWRLATSADTDKNRKKIWKTQQIGANAYRADLMQCPLSEMSQPWSALLLQYSPGEESFSDTPPVIPTTADNFREHTNGKLMPAFKGCCQTQIINHAARQHCLSVCKHLQDPYIPTHLHILSCICCDEAARIKPAWGGIVRHKASLSTWQLH